MLRPAPVLLALALLVPLAHASSASSSYVWAGGGSTGCDPARGSVCLPVREWQRGGPVWVFADDDLTRRARIQATFLDAAGAPLAPPEGGCALATFHVPADAHGLRVDVLAPTVDDLVEQACGVPTKGRVVALFG